MDKISIKLDIVAARELQRAIAKELEAEDGDLEKVLENEEEKKAQDSSDST